mmetsp:Transcript_12057/g.32287  ORF Transcript_12057/g.32287 Transcript_12057/m.32287 type:complete len:212 (+) Transcript_12057:111-746(+)
MQPLFLKASAQSSNSTVRAHHCASTHLGFGKPFLTPRSIDLETIGCLLHASWPTAVRGASILARNLASTTTEELENALPKSSRDCREPVELECRADLNGTQQKHALPSWHTVWICKITASPQQYRPVGVQSQPERHKEHHEQDASHTNGERVPRTPVPEKQHEIQKRSRGLHGQQDGSVQGQHTVPSDDDTSGKKDRMVNIIIQRCQPMQH